MPLVCLSRNSCTVWSESTVYTSSGGVSSPGSPCNHHHPAQLRIESRDQVYPCRVVSRWVVVEAGAHVRVVPQLLDEDLQRVDPVPVPHPLQEAAHHRLQEGRRELLALGLRDLPAERVEAGREPDELDGLSFQLGDGLAALRRQRDVLAQHRLSPPPAV